MPLFGSFTPAPAAAAEPKKISYSETYDKEIREVMDLAGKDRWEEAEIKATALQQKDPKNPMLERIHTWVMQSGQKRREQALPADYLHLLRCSEPDSVNHWGYQQHAGFAGHEQAKPGLGVQSGL